MEKKKNCTLIIHYRDRQWLLHLPNWPWISRSRCSSSFCWNLYLSPYTLAIASTRLLCGYCQKLGLLTLKYPIEQGMVTNWDENYGEHNNYFKLPYVILNQWMDSQTSGVTLRDVQQWNHNVMILPHVRSLHSIHTELNKAFSTKATQCIPMKMPQKA